MNTFELRDDGIKVSTDAPDPLPRIARWVQQTSLPEEYLLNIGSVFLSAATCASERVGCGIQLLFGIGLLLISSAKGYSVGLIHKASASAHVKVIASATETVSES